MVNSDSQLGWIKSCLDVSWDDWHIGQQTEREGPPRLWGAQFNRVWAPMEAKGKKWEVSLRGPSTLMVSFAVDIICGIRLQFIQPHTRNSEGVSSHSVLYWYYVTDISFLGLEFLGFTGYLILWICSHSVMSVII